MRSDSLISFVTDRPGHDRRYAIDCNKITSNLGFHAQITLDQGLRDTLDWYVANDGWWHKVIDKKSPRSQVNSNGTSCGSYSNGAL
jgi:dTDP-glucose 4,6-dehydratase